MDQTQKPVNTEVGENTDLSKQYQDILNQYSKELQSVETKNESTSAEPAPVAAPPIAEPLAPMSVPVMAPEPTPPVFSEPVPVLVPPLETPVVTSLPPMPSSLPPVVAGLAPVANSPKNIFKYFFFISLLVFLGVFGMIIYTVLSVAANPTPAVVSDNSPTGGPTNTPDTGKFCETNDKKIPTGESFPAVDGCNTCTCGDDLTISCTEKDCSVTLSPTPLMGDQSP